MSIPMESTKSIVFDLFFFSKYNHVDAGFDGRKKAAEEETV